MTYLDKILTQTNVQGQSILSILSKHVQDANDPEVNEGSTFLEDIKNHYKDPLHLDEERINLKNEIKKQNNKFNPQQVKSFLKWALQIQNLANYSVPVKQQALQHNQHCAQELEKIIADLTQQEAQLFL